MQPDRSNPVNSSSQAWYGVQAVWRKQGRAQRCQHGSQAQPEDSLLWHKLHPQTCAEYRHPATAPKEMKARTVLKLGCCCCMSTGHFSKTISSNSLLMWVFALHTVKRLPDKSVFDLDKELSPLVLMSSSMMSISTHAHCYRCRSTLTHDKNAVYKAIS